MTSLIYQVNGKVKINEAYEQSFKKFNEHCLKLDIENPIVEGEYFKYLPDTGLTLVDRVDNEFFINGGERDKLENIIDSVDDFIEAALPVVEVEIPLIEQLPQIRRDYESSILTIDGMEFRGDEITRTSLIEAIRFLEELGEQAPEDISWSAENGFFDLSLASLKNIALQIGARRQKAFVAQKQLAQEVTSELIATLEEAKMRFAEIVNINP